MELIVMEADANQLRAGYRCTCGCRPSASYSPGGDISTHICCCGNEFALGTGAEEHVSAKEGFHLETVDVDAPWGGSVQAAWMVGPGVHPPASSEGHGHDDAGHDHADAGGHDGHGHGQAQDEPATVGDTAIDVVCGMTVDIPTALERGLHSHYKEKDYFFCGRGCKLEFDDDPERYLDPAHVPSM